MTANQDRARALISKADALGASDLETVQKLKDLDREITEKQKQLMSSVAIMELLSCGVRMSHDLGERYEANRGISDSMRRCDANTAKTPAERLRTMIRYGRKAQTVFGRRLDELTWEEFVRGTGETILTEDADQILKLGDEQFQLAIRKLHSSFMWADSGCNQFCPSLGLAASLMLTEVPKLEPDEVQLPFKAFAITLPPGVVPFFAAAKDGSTPEWADTVWVEHNEGTILWCVRWQMLEVHRHTDMAFVDRPGDEEEADEDVIATDAAIRFVTNFCLWLNAEGGVAAHRPTVIAPKLAEKRKRGGEEWPKQWEFGKTVTLAPELRRAAAEIALGRSRQHAVDGWKLRARFTVRGHWRNQAHGPGRAMRMRKWIAPFWKGPAGSEAWAHIYKDASQ